MLFQVISNKRALANAFRMCVFVCFFLTTFLVDHQGRLDIYSLALAWYGAPQHNLYPDNMLESSRVEAENYVATRALFSIYAGTSFYIRLPKPFKSLWLDWAEKEKEEKEMALKHEEQQQVPHSIVAAHVSDHARVTQKSTLTRPLLIHRMLRFSSGWNFSYLCSSSTALMAETRSLLPSVKRLS